MPRKEAGCVGPHGAGFKERDHSWLRAISNIPDTHISASIRKQRISSMALPLCILSNAQSRLARSSETGFLTFKVFFFFLRLGTSLSLSKNIPGLQCGYASFDCNWGCRECPGRLLVTRRVVQNRGSNGSRKVVVSYDGMFSR